MGYLTVVITSDSKPKILQASVQIKNTTKQLNSLNFSCPDCTNCFQLKITFDEKPAPVTPKIAPASNQVMEKVTIVKKKVVSAAKRKQFGPSTSAVAAASSVVKVKQEPELDVERDGGGGGGDEMDEQPNTKVARMDPLEFMFMDVQEVKPENDSVGEVVGKKFFRKGNHFL